MTHPQAVSCPGVPDANCLVKAPADQVTALWAKTAAKDVIGVAL